MRSVGALATAVLLVASLAVGCSASPEVAPGCGVVGRQRVVGLLGDHVDSTRHGSVGRLREARRPLRCTGTDADDRGHYVRVVATYHPRPFRLPKRSCDAGWVLAGTPDKYAPACQEGVGRRGRTRLVVRWQPYLVQVTIQRPDHDWAGDPEVALAMSRDLARRLHARG